jgi:hypothetical protein
MARYEWEVVYDTGPPITLSDVQSVSITKGRIQVQDPIKASTATVTGRNLAALPNIEIGRFISITATDPLSELFQVFVGVVSDVQVTYGEVPAMDTWTIHCEDAIARLGRSETRNMSWAAGLTTGQAVIATVFNATQGAVTVTAAAPFGDSRVSAETLNEANVMQVVNQLIATEQGRFYSVAGNSVEFKSRSQVASGVVIGTFTDGTLVSTGDTAKFNDVIFRSQADSFFDQVFVEPDGLAVQTSGTGIRKYVLQSYDQTTTQAQNLADYVLATLQVQDSVPSTLSCISEVQTNNVAMQGAMQADRGGRCQLVLRGVRYELFLNGCTVTATPEQTRFTFNLVSADALNFFILDSTAFGVLDQNKLGF